MAGHVAGRLNPCLSSDQARPNPNARGRGLVAPFNADFRSPKFDDIFQ